MSSWASAIGIHFRASYTQGKKTTADSVSREIDDKLKESVLKGMSTWSGGRYKASIGGLGRPVIQVQVVQEAITRTKEQAKEITAEMERLVMANAKSPSPPPSPGRSRSASPKSRRGFRGKKRSRFERRHLRP
jgi:hypothetical protein